MMHQAEANASPFSVPTLLKFDRFFLLLTFRNKILEVYPTYMNTTALP